MRRIVPILCLVSGVSISCERAPVASPPDVRFVHAVTPDLVSPIPPPASAANGAQGSQPPAVPASPPPAVETTPGGRALIDLFKWIRVEPPAGPGAEFLLLTGDFGIAAAGPAADSQSQTAWETEQAGRIATILKLAPPGLLVYSVPGTSVLSTESIDTLLTRYRRIASLVASELKSSSITFQDLSVCFTGENAGSCAVRAPGTPIRLVGYPSYMVRKPSGTGFEPAAAINAAEIQTRWLDRLEQALRNPDPRVVNILATPLSTPLPAHWITDDLANRFERLAAENIVAGVAIHARETSRFVYQPQGRVQADEIAAAAATGQLLRAQRKLLTAPPLILSTSDIGGQPQGASLISVSPTGDVSRRIYWYDPQAAPFTLSRSGSFSDGPAVRIPASPRPSVFPWTIGSDLKPLTAGVLFAIALISAFLTVAAVWQIPPSASDLAPAAPVQAPADQAKTDAQTRDQLRDTFLSTRLSRTAISGFLGLAAAKIAMTTLAQAGETNADAYYLIWFIWLFLGLLLLSALLRGLLEVGRASVIFSSQPVPIYDGKQSARRSVKRGRLYLFTFGDVFFNVIQGKNNLQPAVWGDTIIRMQENIVFAADRIRESIRSAVLDLLESNDKCTGCAGPGAAPAAPAPVPPVAPAADGAPPGIPAPAAQVAPAAGATAVPVDDRDHRLDSAAVRVAISVLSDDGKKAFYISWAADSLGREFDVHSVAWIVAAAGVARWWKRGDESKPESPFDDLVIFKNKDASGGRILASIDPIDHVFKNFFQKRDQDYKAFVVIPIPFRRRGTDDDPRHGAIHISLRSQKDLDKLFDKFLSDKNFDEAPNLLSTAKKPLADVLNQGVKVMTELLKDFNEPIFLNQIKPKRRV